MSAAESTGAIILRTRPLGESDLLVMLLTPDLGKVATAARNARKSKRRFPGGLPGGAVGRVEIARGRGSLLRLGSFRHDADHGVFGRDLDRFAYAAYLCELTDELFLENEPDPRLYAALHRALTDVRENGAEAVTLRRYELVLLDVLGLLPALDHCAVCGQVVSGEADRSYDTVRGGTLCPAHAGAARRIPAVVLDRARALLDGEGADGATGATTEQRKTLRDLTYGVFREHLRRPLQSLEFFRKMDGSGARGRH